MAHVLDLKRKKEETVIPHPVVREKKVLTDRGERVSYETLIWHAPMTYYRPGNRVPYMLGVLLILGGVVFWFLDRNIISTILFVLLGSMTIVHARRAPPMVEMEISPIGVRKGEKLYPFEDIVSFWVNFVPEQDVRELSIRLKKWSAPYLVLQLGDQDPVQLRAILIEFIPEVKQEDSSLQAFLHLLGL